MAAEWYHQNRGIQAGPIDSRELRQLVEAGIVRPETLIRHGDSGRWVPAEQVRGLFQRSTPSLGATPPIPPPLSSAIPKSGAPSKGVSGETRHGVRAAAVNEASENPERVWPVTWAAIIAGSGTALLLLSARVFRGEQQAYRGGYHERCWYSPGSPPLGGLGAATFPTEAER